ncbi:MAG TPA: hypothetical protein VGR15_05585, partial [Bacteroidota bacterium]|nr:hypothetical protein [Bacteroidota bacterium]
VYDTATIGKSFSPAYLNTVKTDTQHTLIFAAGDSVMTILYAVRGMLRNDSTILGEHMNRIERMINGLLPPRLSAEARVAFGWGIAGTDALLPGECPKNSFLTLPLKYEATRTQLLLPIPGSALILGGKVRSESYLRSLSTLQEMDSTRDTYGQILSKPIAASTTTSSLNLSPWFTLIVQQYFLTTDDTALISEIYPVIYRGIEGLLKFRMDKNSLLDSTAVNSQLHALAPFRMRRRGTQAENAVQALWYKQLSAGVVLAKSIGDGRSQKRWQKIQQKLFKNLVK